jgi:hypothetical protein
MTATVPVVKNKSSLFSVLVKLMVLAALTTSGMFAWSMFYGAKSLDDDLAFLPQQTNVIVRVDLQRFLASSFVQDLRPLIEEQISNAPQSEVLPNDVLKELVLEIETVTLGMHVSNPKKPDEAEVSGVIRFRSEQLLDNLIPAKVAAEASYEETQDGKTIVSIDDGGLCQIDARTIAIGKPSTLREVLQRNGARATLPPELQETLEAADFSKALTVIAATPPNSPVAEAQSAPFMFGPNLDVLKGFVVDADADTDFQLGAKLVMESEAAAKQWSQMIDMFATSVKRRGSSDVTIPDDMFEYSTSGATIAIAMKIPQDFVREGIESRKRVQANLADSPTKKPEAHRSASTTARPRGGIFGKAAIAKCDHTIAELNSALERYYFDVGEWPASIDELAAHSQQDLPRSCRQHGADYAIDPKTHRIIEQGTSRRSKQQHGGGECRQNTAELNSLIERFYFDEGKFPTAITQLVKPDTIVPTFCRVHSIRYAIDPKTHRVIEHNSTAPHSEQPRAGRNHAAGLDHKAGATFDPLAMRVPPSGRLKNSAEAQQVLRDTLEVAGYAGEYLIYSEAERDDSYAFALLVPPFYFDHDSPLLIGVRKEPPYALTAYGLTDANGTNGWATQGRDVFEILQPRRKIVIRESYATPEELFNAFKASATEGDFERYSQVFAGQGKENHATLERMEELGKAFASINYQGFESLAADKVPSLLNANGEDRMSTSEFEFGYLLIGPDNNTVQRLRAARLVDGWRITQD